MKNVWLLAICIAIVGGRVKAQTNMTIETSPDGNEYLLYLPDGYDAAQDYPLILYLHGAQAIGDDISKSFGKGLPGAINGSDILQGTPFMVVAPHLKGKSGNNDAIWDISIIEEILNSVNSIYNVDVNRIIGVGISLGAKGIWDYALANPTTFAGIIPISGNSFLTNICNLSGVAVWAFHGDSDGLIPINNIDTEGNQIGRFGSQVIIDTLSACDPAPLLTPKLTVFKAKGHNGWDEVFDLSSGYNIYEWMVQLEKGASKQYIPLISIGDDKSFVVSSQSMIINSFVFDPDDDNDNLQYNWQQISGTTQTFQNSAPQLSVSLSSADVLTFSLTVTDPDGNSATDDITINVLNAAEGPQVSGLKFYYNGIFIEDITSNYAIDMSVYNNPELINIAADTNNLNARASVRFALDENNNFVTQNDNKITTNYLIGGENGALFKPSEEQTYTIVATAFGDRNALDPGISLQSTITFSSAPLPVELISFTARRVRDEVILNWTTAEEINHSHFELYQGIGNVKEMHKIAEIPGTESNSDLKHYEYRISRAAACGKLYYQLRNVDYDGTTGYSKIINVAGDAGNCHFGIYPNPNSQGLLSIVGDVLYDHARIKIIALDGLIVKEYIVDNVNNPQVSLDVSELKPGIYYVRVGELYRKLVIQ